MKRTLKFSLFAVGLAFALLQLIAAPAALAVDVLDSPCNNANATGKPGICADNQNKDPLLGSEGLITTGINLFSIIIGLIAVVVIIVAGLRFVTSAGDPGRVKGAKQALIYAIVGLIVAAFAQIIVRFVISKL